MMKQQMSIGLNKLVIGMGILDEYDLADDTLKRLQVLYDCPIFTRFDGTPNKLKNKLVDVYERSWMYGGDQAGRWTHDFFSIFLENYPTSEWLMKIDPDSLPVRKLTRLPNSNFGSVFRENKLRKDGKTIFGGVFIIHRSLVEQIVKQELLLGNGRLQMRYTFINKVTGDKNRISSQDAWITKALLNLKVDIDNMEELGIERSFNTPPKGDYAFIHPVYLKDRN